MKYCEFLLAKEQSWLRLDRIKQRYPNLKASLDLATPFSRAPLDSKIEYLLDACDDMFIETPHVKEVWGLLDASWGLSENILLLREEKRDTRLQEQQQQVILSQIDQLIPFIEIHGNVQVEIQWQELDFDINCILRSDCELVDVARTPQLGGIKIVLGTLDILVYSFKRHDLSLTKI